jgi:fructan beta-fructosidase
MRKRQHAATGTIHPDRFLRCAAAPLVLALTMLSTTATAQATSPPPARPSDSEQPSGRRAVEPAGEENHAAPASARSATPTYSEPHRPQLHFTPPSMWMNDPNGLVYYDGEYHLFYQHYPRDEVWGPMHWGHAVSRDLVHWEQLPIALYPDDLGYIFSGSAVVDWDNTSGFGAGGKPPLVAIFTYHDPSRRARETNDRETQGIAYSNDRGRTWTKYKGNPVLRNLEAKPDFRDPKVFRHEPTGRWVMVLAVHDHVELWGSPDLKAWSPLSRFGEAVGAHGGTWECPDLFPLRVEGSGETKWVLIQNLNPGGPQHGSGTQYFVGDFDGKTFTLDPRFERTLRSEPAVWLDWGSDDYAGVTWSDVPASDGRRIFIGWMSNWDYAQQVPTAPWRSAMTVPRTLRLVETDAGYRLLSEPVAELEALRRESVSLAGRRVAGEVDIGAGLGFSPSLSDIELEFDLEHSDASAFGVILANAVGERYRVAYDASRKVFVSDRTRAGDGRFSDAFAVRVHEAPRQSNATRLRMRLLLDVASAELFADGGATVLTDVFFPSSTFESISLYAEGGEADLVTGGIHRLEGIWSREQRRAR